MKTTEIVILVLILGGIAFASGMYVKDQQKVCSVITVDQMVSNAEKFAYSDNQYLSWLKSRELSEVISTYRMYSDFTNLPATRINNPAKLTFGPILYNICTNPNPNFKVNPLREFTYEGKNFSSDKFMECLFNENN